MTPLLARVYPNGDADVNAFQYAGGMAFLVRELRAAGLLNENVVTLMGAGLDAMECAPVLADTGKLEWLRWDGPSNNEDVLRPVETAFDSEGGIRMLNCNLGEGIIKTSAVKPENRRVEAPCVIFNDQDELLEAFATQDFERDFVAVVRYQGPKSNGMPELHQLTPHLGVLQDRGFKVALVTDGRMSGASGKVPAAIHMSPEALDGGPLARLQDGDIICLDADAGTLEVKVDAKVFAARQALPPVYDAATLQRRGTLGRNLFDSFRVEASSARSGASFF